MRMRLSVNELKEYCQSNGKTKFLYYTEDQDWYRVSDPCKLRICFPDMLICENPDIICLKSGADTICFDRVRFIDIDTDASILGTLLTIRCGGIGRSKPEISYRLIAS